MAAAALGALIIGAVSVSVTAEGTGEGEPSHTTNMFVVRDNPAFFLFSRYSALMVVLVRAPGSLRRLSSTEFTTYADRVVLRCCCQLERG